MNRDSSTVSIWQKVGQTKIPKLNNDEEVYDVIIIGAGITGVTTGLFLQSQGKKCLILESHNIAYGTTSGTTAHLNTVLDNPYNKIIQNFGAANAKNIAQGAKYAINIIKSNIAQHNIDCDYEDKKGYIYSENEDETKALEDIYDSLKEVGITRKYVSKIPVPVPFQKAISFTGQAQFNPIKYINSLVDEFMKAGGVIRENTKYLDFENKDDNLIIKSTDREFEGRQLVFATHIPPGLNILHFRCAPYRTYVLGVTLKNENDYPSDLVYDSQDPFHYFRTALHNDKKILIVGGNDHKTGHEEDTTRMFKELKDYVSKYYDIQSIPFQWSAQYFEPVDTMPYIGNLPRNDKVFLACGFSGNGMIFGTLSGKIISDLILGKKNRYSQIFSPDRIKPLAGFINFVKENIDVAKHFVMDRLNIEILPELSDLQNNEGRIVEYDNSKLAIYKDGKGKIKALHPVCPHAKCVVQWNNAETSWDCPCHDARFDVDGNMLCGPAAENLKKIELK